jgi:hypothetical protein
VTKSLLLTEEAEYIHRPVNAGASNIVAKNNYCEGGHGNSIQLQQNGSISNVTFSGTTFVNSLYGGRFKSYQGLSGQISGVRTLLHGPSRREQRNPPLARD